MQLFVKRMIEERDALASKIKKADTAVKSNPYGMSDDDKSLLSEQLGYMKEYLRVLNKRISIHEKN